MNEIIKTLNAIIADLNIQLGKLNVATEMAQFEILSSAKNVLLLYLQLLANGTTSLVIEFLTSKIILEKKEKGIAKDLNEQGHKCIQALYDGCQTAALNANADLDGIINLLMSLHKHLEDLIVVVEKHTPLQYCFFKSDILKHLNQTSMFFWVLAAIRKFNIQNPHVLNLINFIGNLKKLVVCDPEYSLGCLLESSSATLQQHLQNITQHQQFYYFDFSKRLGESFEFSCIFPLLQFLRLTLRRPYKPGIMTPNDALITALSGCYDKLADLYTEEHKLTEANQKQTEILVKELKQLRTDLSKGTKICLKEKNPSFEDQLISPKLLLLDYNLRLIIKLPDFIKEMQFCIGITYQELEYGCGSVQRQALINKVLAAEVRDIRALLIDLYELVVSKNHPLKGTFKEIFARGAAKELTEKALDLLIRANIDRILGIPRVGANNCLNIDQESRAEIKLSLPKL